MDSNIRGVLRDWCIAMLLATVAVGYAIDSDLFWRLDHGVYDELTALGREPASDEIVIVAIDDESLNRLGTWPWPRDVHARLLDTLAQAGAKAILYDVLFLDPTAHDDALAAAMARTHPILPLYFEVPGRDGAAATTIRPLASLLQGGAVSGHSNLSPDADGIVRQAYLREGANGTLWPHVAALLACRAQHRPCPGETSTSRQSLVREGAYLIPFKGGAGHYRRVPFSAVLDGSVPASFFRNRIVLIGSTTTSLGDNVATPLSPQQALMPGVELNANLVQSLMEGDRIAPAPRWVHYAFALALVYALLASFLFLRPRQSFAVAAGLALFAIAVAVGLWFGGIWLSPIAALAAIGVTYPLWAGRRLQVAASYMHEELERFRRDAAFQTKTATPALTLPEQDLDQLRGAIAESRDLLDFLRDTLNGLPDSSLVLEADGMVRMQNSRAAALLGEVEGQHFSAVIAKMTGGRVAIPIAAAPGEDALPTEIANGAGRIFDVRWARIRQQHRDNDIWVLRLADVTDLRIATRQREEALQLLTHDMRSPQVSILVSLDQAKDTLDPDLARRIEDYARRTLALADGFVDLARAEARDLTIAEINFPDIVLDAADSLWPQATAKQITITTEGCDTELWGWGDRELLTRAIINLADNAIKYSPPHTPITCAVRSEAGEIVFTVRDTGPGIAPDAIAKLFDSFSRAGQQDQKGVGLGLAFVRSVAQKHGGTATCTSILGEGSCFELRIPQAPASAALPAPGTGPND